MRSLGADEVVDYTARGLHANGGTYDVVLDAVGKQLVPHAAGSSLKPGAAYVVRPTSGYMWHVPLLDPPDPLARGQAGRSSPIAAATRQEDVAPGCRELIEAGRLPAP